MFLQNDVDIFLMVLSAFLISVGADISAQYSSITHTGAGGGYYCHIKGLVEQTIIDHNFPSTAIFRPAAIIGNSNTGPFASWLAPKFDCTWMIPTRFNY